MSAKYLFVDILNGLRYPQDYALKSKDEQVFDCIKEFETLKVANLEGVSTINNIPASDFITLSSNVQKINHLITFENTVVVDGNFEVNEVMITNYF